MDISKFAAYTNGITHYSREQINQKEFNFLGFEEFFDSNYGLGNSMVRHIINNPDKVAKLKTFNTIEKYYYQDTVERSDILTITRFNFDNVFIGANKKTFGNGINLIFSQWIDFAKKNNVDISDELTTFNQIHNESLAILKKVEQFKKAIETLRFKAVTYADYGDTLDIKNNKGKDIIKYITDNMEFFKSGTLEDLCRSGFNGLVNQKDKYVSLTEKILAKVRINNPSALENYAESYKSIALTETESLSNVQKFLFEKIDETFFETVELSRSQKNQKAIMFADASFLFIERDGNLLIPNSGTELKDKINELFVDIIDYKMRKQPTFAKLFKNKFKEDGEIEKAISTVDNFIANYNVLKIIGIPNDFFEKSFEVMDDFIVNSVKKHKVTQYAGSILSAKNKHLYTDTAYPFFEKFYDEGLKKEFIQDYIGKKLSLLKSPEDFNDFVKKLHDELFVFGKATVERQLETINKKALFINDDMAIIQINNFEESNKLGTNNWCISRSSTYFNDYTNNNQNQYFIYDFTKESEDTLSMIGITINDDGTLYAAHKKNDDSVTGLPIVTDFRYKILALQFEEYEPYMNESLKLKILEMNDVQSKNKLTLKQA
jgi:hypothetical protein